MYYYIFDLKKCRKQSLVSDIKNYLSILGISGEYTYPSPAYTVEELVDLGISKKYNTIVGIGDDDIANKIAARLCGHSEAMGIIPIEASEHLCDLIGSRAWKEAAENLRFRKIQEMKIGRTASGGAFITDLELQIKSPVEVTIEFRDYLVQAKVSNLLISNFNPRIKKIGGEYLDVILQSVDPKGQGLFAKIFGGAKDDELEVSMFRGRSLRLFTSSQIPLTCAGYPIAKTPQLVESSDENLRLIVGKKSKYSDIFARESGG